MAFLPVDRSDHQRAMGCGQPDGDLFQVVFWRSLADLNSSCEIIGVGKLDLSTTACSREAASFESE